MVRCGVNDSMLITMLRSSIGSTDCSGNLNCINVDWVMFGSLEQVCREGQHCNTSSTLSHFTVILLLRTLIQITSSPLLMMKTYYANIFHILAVCFITTKIVYTELLRNRYYKEIPLCLSIKNIIDMICISYHYYFNYSFADTLSIFICSAK